MGDIQRDSERRSPIRVGVFGADDTVVERIRSDPGLAVVMEHASSDPMPFGSEPDFDVAVLGPRITEPIRVTQGLRLLDPRLGVVVVCEAVPAERLVRAVELSPLMPDGLGFVDRARIDTDLPAAIAKSAAARLSEPDVDASGGPRGETSLTVLGGALLDQAPIAGLIVDADLRVISWNRGAFEILRLAEEDLAGIFLPSLFVDAEEVAAALRPVASGDVAEGVHLRRQPGGPQYLEVRAATVQGLGEGVTVVVLRDATPFMAVEMQRRHSEELLHARARQQSAVAQLGLRALTGATLDELMDEAVHLVSSTLAVEMVKVLELLPGGERLRLRAGVGWQQGLIGTATVPAGDSQAGYTLGSASPVIVENLREERRFRGPRLLLDHGVVSGLSVIIHGPHMAFGVLGAHTTERRRFTGDDAYFLQSIANVLAGAVGRWLVERDREQLLMSERAARAAAEHAVAAESSARASAEQASGRLAFLADAGSLLSESLDYRQTLRQLARLIVPKLADWCAIDVPDDEGTLERLVVVHPDPDKERLAAELERRYPTRREQPFGLYNVFRTGRPELYTEIPEELIEASAQDAEHRATIQQLELRSAMIVPMVARGRVVGVITFASAESGRRYGERDLELARELTQRAALAVDNARLFGDVEAAELHFRTLLQGVDAVVWEAVAEPERRITFVTDRAEDLLGFPVWRWTEPGFWFGLIHPRDRDAVAEIEREAVGARRDHEIEYRAVNAWGSVVWLRDVVQVSRSDQGVVTLRGITLDITRTKEQQLRRDAQRGISRALAESASFEAVAPRVLRAIADPLGWDAANLWLLDRSAQVMRCEETMAPDSDESAAFVAEARLLAFERGEGLPGRVWAGGEPVWIEDFTKDPAFSRAAVAQAAGFKAAFAFPIVVLGEVTGVIEFFCDEIREPDPDLLRLVADIGSQIGQFVETRAGETALRESEARKTAILESSLDAIITIDAAGMVVEMNPAAESVFGYGRDAAVGSLLEELIVPPRLRAAHREGIARLGRGEAPRIMGQRVEMPAVRADGRELTVELALTRVDRPGEPLYTGYIRDITERRRIEEALRFQRTLLVSQNEATIDGILVVSSEGQILYYNGRLLEIWGLSDEVMMSLSDDEALTHSASQVVDADAFMARVAELYEHPDLEAQDEVALLDGRILDRWTAPLRGEDGRHYGRAWYFRDITERKRTEAIVERSRRHFEFLAQASTLLAASLDHTAVMTRLAQLAAGTIADWSVVDLVAEDGTLRRLAAAHRDPSLQDIVERLRDHPADIRAAGPETDVLRSGGSDFRAKVGDGDLEELAIAPDHLVVLRELGCSSWIIVPLQARGRVLGVLMIARSTASYDGADLALAEDLARRAALAADNARLYQDRSHVARTLQESLLPPSLPEVAGAQVAACYHAAGEGNEVGGDFYDLFATDHSHTMVMGDVCGKGAEAASLTALTRYTIRALARGTRKPSRMLAMLNEAILQQRSDKRFCTVALVRVTSAEGGLRAQLCTAGHPPPLLLRRDGTVEAVEVAGTLLGVFADPELRDADVWLAPGDAILLYTDGVTEARGPAGTFGDEALRETLGACAGMQAGEIVRAIEEAVLSLQHGRPRDDVALLVLRVDDSATS